MKYMKRVLLAVLSGGVVLAGSVVSQEAPQKPREEAVTKPEATPSREQARERMKNSPEMQKLREEIMALPPEQREAKMKEIREKFAKEGAPAPEALKQREEANKLTPEQREAKLKEMKEREAKAPGAGDLERRREEFKNLPPEQREAKMKEFREQFMARRTELEKKKAVGTLTPEEEKALDRMNEMAKRGGKDGQTRRPKAE
jgi:colicin import membrane protein